MRYLLLLAFLFDPITIRPVPIPGPTGTVVAQVALPLPSRLVEKAEKAAAEAKKAKKPPAPMTEEQRQQLLRALEQHDKARAAK